MRTEAKLSRVLQGYVLRLAARRHFQPVYKLMYRLALAGMNIGTGSGVDSSGETYAFSLLARLVSSRPLVVIDGGANRGLFTQAVLKEFGQAVAIYAFEPAHSTFQQLASNLSPVANVRLYNLGLGEREETLPLYSDRDGSGMASVYHRDLSSRGLTMDRVESIQVVTLDRFCVETQIPHIHYLKLDVEGHEFNVLKGASQMLSSGSIDLIQFEFGGCNVDARVFFRDLFNTLQPWYDVFRILQNGLEPIWQYSERDEIFITTNYLAISRTLVSGNHWGAIKGK